jgi:hypothetical protein
MLILLLRRRLFMSVASTADPKLWAAVRSCVRALQQVANYTLPPALDRQLQELGERKEFLDHAEHEQLLALIQFTQQRTAEKLQAELALRQLEGVFPGEVLA